MATLRNTIAKKDEEIERLQLLRELKNVYPSTSSGDKDGSVSSSPRFNSPSPSREPIPETSQKRLISSTGKSEEKEKEIRSQSELGQKIRAGDDHELSGFGENNADYDQERLSDNSDGDLSVGTESTDRSIENAGPPKSNR